MYLCLVHSTNLFNLLLGKEEYHLVYNLGKVASISATLSCVLWIGSFHLCLFFVGTCACLPRKLCTTYIWRSSTTVSFTQTCILTCEREELKIWPHSQCTTPWWWMRGEGELGSFVLLRGWSCFTDLQFGATCHHRDSVSVSLKLKNPWFHYSVSQ